MNKKGIFYLIGLTVFILLAPSIIGLENNIISDSNGFEEELEIKIKGGIACRDLHQITLEIKNKGQTTYEFPVIILDVDGINIFTGLIWERTLIIDGTQDPIIIRSGVTSFNFSIEKLEIPEGFGIVLFQVCFYLDIPGCQDAHCFIDSIHYNDLIMTKQVYHPLEPFNSENGPNAIFQK